MMSSPLLPSTEPEVSVPRHFATPLPDKTLSYQFPWFSKAEVDRSATIVAGVSLSEERNQRRAAATFLAELTSLAAIKPMALATASIYLHIFFVRNSFKDFDAKEIALTCMFLAGKVEDERCRLSDLIALYFKHTNGPHLAESSEKFKSFRSHILQLETRLLDAIEFMFILDNPFRYLNGMLTPGRIFSKELCTKIGQAATFFTNDSLRSTVYMYTKAQRVAAACVFLAICFFNRSHPTLKEKPWYLSFFNNMDELIDLCDTLTEEAYPEKHLRCKIKDSYRHIVVFSSQDQKKQQQQQQQQSESHSQSQPVSIAAKVANDEKTQRFVVSKVHVTQTEFVCRANGTSSASASATRTTTTKTTKTGSASVSAQCVGTTTKKRELLPCPRCHQLFSKHEYDVHRLPCKSKYESQKRMAPNNKRSHPPVPRQSYSSTKRQKHKQQQQQQPPPQQKQPIHHHHPHPHHHHHHHHRNKKIK